MTNNAKISQSRKKMNISVKFNPFEFFECIVSFFLNKICLFGALSPFGISYFAATFPLHEMSFATIFAFSGIVFAGFGISSLKYIGALSLYLIFMLLYNKDISEKMWISALAGSSSLLASGTVFIILDGFLLYDMLLLILESISCFVSFFAFEKASDLIRTFKKRTVFEPADILGVVFLFSAFLLAVMSIPGGEIISQILAVSAILSVAYLKGFQLSCPTGLVLGIVMSTTSVLPSHVICTYTLSSLCAGLFKRYGKIGVCLGFLFANALLMIYLNSSTITIINFVCIVLGTILILLIPKSFENRLSAFADTPLTVMPVPRDSFDADIVSHKIKKTSDALYEISDMFAEITQKSIRSNELAPGAIFDATIDSVCADCSLCTYCWHKNYDDTIEEAKEMFSKMSARGYAIEFDAPPELRSKCIYFDDFLEAVNKNYELQKINISWASKVLESKGIVLEQFKNISSVLKNLQKEIDFGMSREVDLELKIKAALDKKGLYLPYVKVISKESYEVFLTISNGGKSIKERNLISVLVASVLGVPVYIEEITCSDSECNIKFCEKTKYSADVAFAKTTGANAFHSGDTHLFSALPNGKYMLCLSDGMGRGKDAADQSKSAALLIKKLLSLGFDKEISLKIINTFLLLKSQSETFATADVCILNLNSGALEFIKSGAVSSYIKSKNETKRIKCSSLPAGTVPALSADCDLSYVKDGDFVVMMSDGITDILETDKHNYLREIINNFKGESPQDLADEILKAAMEKRAKASADDMTVLAMKIAEEM